MKHLERALDNQNHWWKYLVIIVAALIASQIIGAIPLAIVIALKTLNSGGFTPNADNIADFSVYGIPPNLSLVLLMIPFLLGLITLIILVKPLHKRNWKEVANGTSQIRWNRFITGFLIWVILMGINLAIAYYVDRDNFQINFNPASFAVLIIISFLLIPFQTTFEELMFRGYISQGIAAWTRNRWLVLVIPSFFFGMMHYFNPEVKEFGFWLTMPQYWLFGLLFGLLTILDDGIELAMGVHAANNIFMSVMVTHHASVLQTPALLTQNKIEPIQETIFFVLISIAFIVILSRKYNWKFSVLNQKIEPQL